MLSSKLHFALEFEINSKSSSVVSSTPDAVFTVSCEDTAFITIVSIDYHGMFDQHALVETVRISTLELRENI